jgi:hypothetical protein
MKSALPPTLGESDRPPGSFSVWRHWLGSAAAAIFLSFWFFSPARQIVDPTLDVSNYASFSYFTAHEFQFGREVMHVGGPYGFIHYGFVYGGNLFWKRLGLEFLTKLALGCLIVWFFRRSHGHWLRWFWLGALLLLTPLVEDLPYDIAILLGGLCLLDCHLKPGSLARVTGWALTGFLALLTLVKGTHAMLALATFGLLGLQAMLARDYRRLPGLACAYLLALLALLLIAGQNPLNLPAYLHSIIEQSSGYNAAMALEEPLPIFLSGAGALLSLELLLVLLVLPRWRQPVMLTGGLLLAGFTFVEWKHGFVRADGHVFIFFQYACFAAPTILLYNLAGRRTDTPAWLRPVGFAIAGLAFALGIWGDGPIALARHRLALHELPRNLVGATRQIFFPARAKAELDTELANRRQVYELPLIRDKAGNSRIDFFGTEHGYLTLNRLNYRPRPMGGGNFSVFNAWAQDLNEKYVSNPATAPEFFLTRVGIFDNRFLSQDDAGTLRVLLAQYAPIDTEQGMVLFRRQPESSLLEPRPLGGSASNPNQPDEPSIAFDQPIDPPLVAPGEMLAIELSLPLNLAGRLRGLLYKPPLIYLSLEGDGIEYPESRRIVPGLFNRPVILNPVLENTRDIIALYQGQPGKHARRLRLHTAHPGFFATEHFEIRYYTLPRPSPPAGIDLDLLQRKMAFVVSNTLPALMVPANAPPRQFDGLPVQMIEPPGLIRFALSGDEREVRFKYGMDPEAYTRGRTDGVEFIVDLEPPGQPPHTLFRRWLRPRTVSSDRSTQNQRVVLPPFPPGSTLALRTDPGPDHDGAWDWSYYTGIRLLGGAYLPEQFPNFNRIPLVVDAAVAGSLPDNGRQLFMLNSPGSLTFKLQGSERSLAFTAGLLAGAYTQGGDSDGVEFLVDLRTPAGVVSRIFQQRLNPRDNPVDRGDRPFTVPLPALAPGTQLILTVSPGPDGNAAWDWSYIERLHFD